MHSHNHNFDNLMKILPSKPIPEDQCKIWLGDTGTFVKSGTLFLHSNKDAQSDKIRSRSQLETTLL